MRAFKAFNKDMTCTMGNGSFQYKENTTYREDKAQAHETGFHCAGYILDCFRYYPKNENTIICPVEASGDVDEDGTDTKISCTVMTIGQRLTLDEIVFEAVKYLAMHPKFRDINNVHEDKGKGDFFCIVRGRDPVAAGSRGAVLGLVKEYSKHQVTAIAVYRVNGKIFKPGRYYNIEGEEVTDEES